ncbi:MAG: cyclic nucleotide-binding domain-containing protein [Halobacteriovoraceae bacterium]|nr:cyclic nucleotide-binding domain-containing protein [Halobacteriovoraceae bacterium]
MRRLRNSRLLTDEELANFTKFVGPRTYHTSSIIIYEGHYPHVAFLLVEGNIEIVKRNKKVFDVKKGVIIGLSELLNERPCKYSVKINANSKVCIIDKSTLDKISKLEDNKIKNIISSSSMAC